jgi:L-cysteine desulfidase
LSEINYNKYLAIMKEELVPAYGCTEPIALSYAAALARDYLKEFPVSITAHCSGNIIKNCKGVIVPGTGDLRGIPASVYMGLICGRPEKQLEVISGANQEDLLKVRELMNTDLCKVKILDTTAALHIIIRMESKAHYSEVTLMHSHTNVAKVVVDGNIIVDKRCGEDDNDFSLTDRSILNVRDIIEFANTVDIEDVKEILDMQISYNMAIAEEGLTGNWGVGIGKTIIEKFPNDIMTKAIAYAASASEARMNGCEMPVVINSGSGNQGITVSLPVIVYAKGSGKSGEELYRALVASNLIAIHLKTGIGRLSAYCGAVSAACGAGVGITYLAGGDIEAIERTITNGIGNVSGIVCDGAKTSCAAKIAISLEAAILAHRLGMSERAFEANTGLIKENIEDTIISIGQMGNLGMRQTDKEILKIMIS